MVAWCRRRRAGNAGIVRALFNRQGVAIAGRDGTLAQTGGTGSTALHPTYGSVQSSGALISHSLAIPGVDTLPLSFAQGARQNLIIQSQDLSTSWTFGNASAGAADTAPDRTSTARKLVEDGTNNYHYATTTAVISKAASALPYTLSFYCKAAERTAIMADLTGAIVGNRMRANIDLSAGTVSIAVAGTFTSPTASIAPVGGGWFRVVMTCTSDTAVSVRPYFYITASPYLGDGASGLYVWGAQLEQSSFPGLYIPTTTAALTRAADNILWTPPSALSTTSGEVVAIAAPYLWSAGAGVAHPSGASGALFDAAGKDYVTRTATEACIKRDTGDTVNQSAGGVASLADSSGVLLQRSQYWDAVVLRYYRGTTLAGSDSTLSGPWTARANVYVGGEAGALSWHGFVGLIYVPGGLTDAERIALASVTGGSLTYVG